MDEVPWFALLEELTGVRIGPEDRPGALEMARRFAERARRWPEPGETPPDYIAPGPGADG